MWSGQGYATFGRMTGSELAAFYRRYNACCNEHTYDELGAFVAHDVAINGVERGRDAYVDGQRSVVRAFPDYRWNCGTSSSTRRGSPRT